MLVTDKVNQLATDSNLVHSWAHGTETVTTEGGVVRTPAKLIADKDVEMTAAATAAINLAIAGDLAVVTSVADNISNVNAVGAKLVAIQTVVDNLIPLTAINNKLTTITTVKDNITQVNSVSTKLLEIKAAADNLTTIASVGSNIAKVQTVSNNMTDVNAVVDNLAYVQASSANAAIAAESANYVSNYVDAIVLKDMAFPLDLGLIVDPVPFANTFDLGAL